jgi:hypothetical protein
MENLEWFAVPYNGLETNIEVTKCGRVKRVKKDWCGNHKSKYGEIDFSKLKLDSYGYKRTTINIYSLEMKTARVQQLIASTFLNYKFEGHKLVVDHIDNNPLNNNLNNLRVVTNRENCSRLRSEKSGLPTGVSLDKRRNKYISRIRIGDKRFTLGRFNTIEEASQAYQNKLKSL